MAAIVGPYSAELANAEVSGAAANALCQLCEECGAKLAPYLETLMALYQRVTSAGQASTSGGGPPPAIAEDSIQQACPYGAFLALQWQRPPHSKVKKAGECEAVQLLEMLASEVTKGVSLAQIVQAVAMVVSDLPAEQRRAGLTALMSPIITQLEAALQQPGTPGAAGGALNGGHSASAQPTSYQDLAIVERLTTLFRYSASPSAEMLLLA